MYVLDFTFEPSKTDANSQTFPTAFLSYQNVWISINISLKFVPETTTSTPIHARAWKEKALAGDNSQQLPTNNNIHKMLIIIISLRWKHFVVISYLYKIPRINEPYNQRKKGHKTNTYRHSHSLTSSTDGSQLSFILSLRNCIMRKSIVEHCGICINLSVFISQ